MRKIYEDEKIVIKETGQDYDFIATVENKTGEDVTFCANDVVAADGSFYQFVIPANDWLGILADEEGRAQLKAIKGVLQYE
jgi:hypothetical protein